MHIFDGYHSAPYLEKFRTFLSVEHGIQMTRVTAIAGSEQFDAIEEFGELSGREFGYIVFNGLDNEGYPVMGAKVPGNMDDFNYWIKDNS